VFTTCPFRNTAATPLARSAKLLRRRTSQRDLVHRSLKPKKSGIVTRGEYGHRVYRRGGSGNTMRGVLYRRSVPNDYRRFECRKNWRCWCSFETFVQFVERRKSIDSISDIVTDAGSAERQLNESTKAAVSLVTASKSFATLQCLDGYLVASYVQRRLQSYRLLQVLCVRRCPLQSKPFRSSNLRRECSPAPLLSVMWCFHTTQRTRVVMIEVVDACPVYRD
jgi:hypothetical protein